MYGKNYLRDLEDNGYKTKNFSSDGLNEYDSRKLYRSYEGQVRNPTKMKVGEAYPKMMKPFGLNISLSISEKVMLTEINAVRNCIMHRGGILDEKATHDVMLKRYQLGQKIVINNELYMEYHRVISKFAVSLLGEAANSKYVEKKVKNG